MNLNCRSCRTSISRKRKGIRNNNNRESQSKNLVSWSTSFVKSESQNIEWCLWIAFFENGLLSQPGDWMQDIGLEVQLTNTRRCSQKLDVTNIVTRKIAPNNTNFLSASFHGHLL